MHNVLTNSSSTTYAHTQSVPNARISQLLMPGLVNCHIHSAQYVNSGLENGGNFYLVDEVVGQLCFKLTYIPTQP